MTVKIPTLVKHSGDGDVLNAAQVYENDPNTGQEKEPKNTPTVHTYYGGITFTKVSAKMVLHCKVQSSKYLELLKTRHVLKL